LHKVTHRNSEMAQVFCKLASWALYSHLFGVVSLPVSISALPACGANSSCNLVTSRSRTNDSDMRSKRTTRVLMLTFTLLFVNSMVNGAVSWRNIPLGDWQLLLASQVSLVLKDCILYVREGCVCQRCGSVSCVFRRTLTNGCNAEGNLC